MTWTPEDLVCIEVAGLLEDLARTVEGSHGHPKLNEDQRLVGQVVFEPFVRMTAEDLRAVKDRLV